MKVLLANKFFFRNGGSETVFFQERDFLLSQGIEVADFSMQDPRNLPSAQADSFVRQRSYHGGGGVLAKLGDALSLIHSPEAVARIEALIERERPDILHCHNIYHQLTPSIMRAAKRRGVKVVLTMHDFKVVCPTYLRLRHGQACTDCETGDFFNVVRHRCAEGSLARSGILWAEAVTHRALGSYEAVDHVIAPTRFLAQSVTKWRFAPDRVSVIYNGIDAGTLPQAIGQDQGYLLYLGRLSAEKGPMVLGEAHKGSGLRVVVAGTGPLEAQMRQGFPELEMLGHVDRSQVGDLIAKASALVVPSICHENCPMSVLEAMAVGKPVIATRIGGLPELVTHGESGLLFSPGHAGELRQCMQDLAQDPARRAAMGTRARERAMQEFSVERHNEALLSVYRQVLGRQAESPARSAA